MTLMAGCSDGFRFSDLGSPHFGKPLGETVCLLWKEAFLSRD